ncbi:hypothetical protein CPB85DRAFT_360375 [Mucidula mucida]|nr:hypothetical protein CPB85DRAFT_360375 [Mucidula mucida]
MAYFPRTQWCRSLCTWEDYEKVASAIFDSSSTIAKLNVDPQVNKNVLKNARRFIPCCSQSKERVLATCIRSWSYPPQNKHHSRNTHHLSSRFIDFLSRSPNREIYAREERQLVQQLLTNWRFNRSQTRPHALDRGEVYHFLMGIPSHFRQYLVIIENWRRTGLSIIVAQ